MSKEKQPSVDTSASINEPPGSNIGGPPPKEPHVGHKEADEPPKHPHPQDDRHRRR